MDEKIFLVEEIKDINLEIGAANLFLQRAENQDELKVILAKGEMAHFLVTKQENQLEMSYKKNGKISREETDEIIVQIPENHHLENMSVSIGAGKLKAENITVMERLGLEVGAGKAKLKNMHVRNLAIECGVGKCHYEGVLEHDMKVQCGVGQVEAELDAEESDYNYSISCALGKIKINDNSMGTFASEKTIQHANARGNIALECWIVFSDANVPMGFAQYVEKIDMDGGNEVYMNIIPQWDGEDECFDLNNITSSEIRQFPNLKKATIMSSNFDKVKEIFDAENIDVELL